MGPGVPGMGIASVFYVAAALVAPVRELVRTLQGKSSVMRWRVVARQFSLALSIVGSIVLLYLCVQILISRGLLPVPDATDLPGRFPNWSYAVGILAIVLIAVTLTAWAVGVWVRRTGIEDEFEAIAQAYRATIPTSGRPGHGRMPHGRHVARLPHGRHVGRVPHEVALFTHGSGSDFAIDLRALESAHEPRGRHLAEAQFEESG